MHETSITFRAPGREPLTGVVKNPSAKIGAVAARVALKMGLAGGFECLTRESEAIDPETPLADLPDTEITLASELTPA